MWLNQLGERLASLDVNVAGPDGSVEDCERVLGAASNSVKQLWVLRQALAQESREKMAELVTTHILEEKGHDKAACEKRQKELARIGQEAMVVDQILWLTIHTEHDIWNANIGIRENWQIVTEVDSDHEEVKVEIQNGIRRLIEGVFGPFRAFAMR